MTRRGCLVRMFGAATAAALVPLVDLTDATPAFWNQPPIQKLMPWRITFPDGVTWSFNATVLAEKMLDDGSMSFTVRPSGSMKMSQEVSFPINFGGEVIGKATIVPSPHAPATILEKDGLAFDLQDIEPPTLERMPLGLKRGNMSFRVKFREEP